MTNKETAYQKISELVKRFDDQFESYKKSDYNETQTRRDFIDPFFKALGWDIDNEEGYAEAYREVIHEDRVNVGGATKAPDYAFRVGGGKRLFFVEAKKPSVAVKDDILPAYQVRRYGWSAKLSISIITDFEEFAIYDCTKKPIPTDKASVARVKYISYKDYLSEFDFIWNTFSREQVLKGSFDKFIKGTANKKGTATVDKEFLQSLDNWRTYLATSISWNNKDLDEDEINFVVQQTIDRIIFLRIAEDRSVEPYGNLKNALKQGDYYQNLFNTFKEADQKYNSGLFDLKKDQISKNLKIDNKVIKTIVNELYYPESPYEFSVLSVEILGSAYEQFLGKVIRITKGHHAKVEEKPEVRKAGGVYYTPQYIVEYIVKNTVGKLIDGKTPNEISKIKIVDPACGSGSFLIGAYQYLLDFHKDFYTNNGKPSKGKKDNPLTPEGNLTTGEKKRILLNNIFGVDIDVNAVEVTKLSLLLKCMEGETQASIGYQLSIFNERVLPTLENNIKDGNSLIDVDYYDGQIDFGEEKKIKPFSWQKAFPVVFKEIEIKEERALFHVTCVMHNSRSSQRMVDFKVKTGESEYLSIEEESKLIKIISKIIREDKLRIVSLNLCADHLHFIIACNPEKLGNIVGKLKSISAKEFNIWRGITTPLTKETANFQTRGHAPLSNSTTEPTSDYLLDSQTRGHAPLSNPNAPLSNTNTDLPDTTSPYSSRGETQNSLWAQKFNRKVIDSDSQLNDTINYIENNRIKHELPSFSADIIAQIETVLTPIEKAFDQEIIKAGFDCVIGNPPYGATFNQIEKDYFTKKYKVSEGNYESFSFFIERAKSFLITKGLLGYIIPDTWFALKSSFKLRKFILDEFTISEIQILNENVFKSARVDVCTFIIAKDKKDTPFTVYVYDKDASEIDIQQGNFIAKNLFTVNDILADEELSFRFKQAKNIKTIIEKISSQRFNLDKYCLVVTGCKPYQVGKGKPAQTKDILEKKLFTSTKQLNETYRLMLRGADIARYSTIKKDNEWLSYGEWLAEPRIPELFNKPRLVFQSIRNPKLKRRLIGTFVNDESVNNNSITNIILKDEKISLKFFLGILNSDLMNWYFSVSYNIVNIDPRYLKMIPIPNSDTKTENELCSIVDQLLKLNEEKARTKLQTQLSQIQTRIDYCEDRINKIVYQLYDLTEEEIKIVEAE